MYEHSVTYVKPHTVTDVRKTRGVAYVPNERHSILRCEGESPGHDELNSLDELPVLWVSRCKRRGNAAEVEILKEREEREEGGREMVREKVRQTSSITAIYGQIVESAAEITHTHSLPHSFTHT
jgi:hypothetical protein